MLPKTLKAFVLILSLFALFFVGCQDNDNSPTNPSSDEYLEKQIAEIKVEHDGYLEKLIEYLVLTDDQVEQIKTFLTEQRKDLREEFGKGKRKNRENFKEIKEQLRKEFQEFLLTILTDVQKANLEEMHEKNEAEHQAEWIAKLTEALSLTDNQVDQITEILQYKATKMKEIFDGDYSIEERRELIQALTEELKTKMAEVLTNDQLEKLKELMKKGKHHHSGGKP